MAKKKRKHRTPVAPPVHSAPSTPQQPSVAPSARPDGTPPPAQAPEAAAPRRTREMVRERQQARKRRSRIRTYLIVGGVVALIAGVVVGQRVVSNRAVAAFNELATSNGCGDLRVTGSSGAGRHLAEGEAATYDTSPPTHGEHSTGYQPAGVYNVPFSNNPRDEATIFKSVHSLEHGYIIISHEGLEDGERRELETTYRNQHKVIVVPYDGLEAPTTVALTAWGHKVLCEGASVDVIDAFIDRYREAGSAPEPNAA